MDFSQISDFFSQIFDPAFPASGLILISLRILLIVVVAIVGWIAAHRLMRHWIELLLKSDPLKSGSTLSELDIEKRSTTLVNVALRTVEVAIMGVVAFMLLAEVGVNIAPLLAGAGVLGIAIGFGAQSFVKDILAGIIILVENHYTEGDIVEIAGVGGSVQEVNLRRTVLRDLDGTVHFISNGEITRASNKSRTWARMNLNIEVNYREDLDHVRDVVNDVGREMAEDPEWAPLITEAPHLLRIDNFGDSGIAVKILAVVAPGKQWDVTGEYRRRVKRRFDEEGIEIPFPHRTVIMRAESPSDSGPRSD